MKKFLALFLATMMCLTVFVACNGGGTDASETTTADTTTDASTTTLGGNEETTTDPTVENETTTESLDDQKVVENFYPETLVTKLKNKLSESPSSFSISSRSVFMSSPVFFIRK